MAMCMFHRLESSNNFPNSKFHSYPARDTRMDGKLGAKRIEWSFSDGGLPWAPIPSVNNAGMACKNIQIDMITVN
jgi:hypothetical protein